MAVVRMRVQRDIGLPEDTIASVRTRGLIGDKYISLSPGASDRMIPAGGRRNSMSGRAARRVLAVIVAVSVALAMAPAPGGCVRW